MTWLAEDGNVAGRDFVGPLDEHVSPPAFPSVGGGGHRGRRSPAPTSSISSSSGDIRKSAFVCQDGTLRLSCTAGKHIDVLRANFGRFSITLCNPSGTLDWSVNCASGNSLSVLTQRSVLLCYSAMTALLQYSCIYCCIYCVCLLCWQPFTPDADLFAQLAHWLYHSLAWGQKIKFLN